MIKTGDLKEYQAIKCITNYCNQKRKEECKNCQLEELCNCSEISFNSIEMEFSPFLNMPIHPNTINDDNSNICLLKKG